MSSCTWLQHSCRTTRLQPGGINLEMTATTQWKPRINLGGFRSKILNQFEFLNGKLFHENCLLSPLVRAVSMYCVVSIYLFSIFNGRIPQLLSAPGGGPGFYLSPSLFLPRYPLDIIHCSWYHNIQYLAHLWACHISADGRSIVSIFAASQHKALTKDNIIRHCTGENRMKKQITLLRKNEP